MSDLLSIESAAEIIGLSPETTRYHVRRGRLRAVRLGRRVYGIHRAEAEAFRDVRRALGR